MAPSPEGTHTPKDIISFTPEAPPFAPSSESKTASDTIAQNLREGKPVDKAQVDALVDAVKAQLRSEGVTVSEEDESYWRQNAQELLGGVKKEPPKPVPQEKRAGTLEDLSYYIQEFDRVSREYGLDKKAWKLGVLESCLALSRGLRGYGLQYIIQDILGNKRVRKMLPLDFDKLEERSVKGEVNFDNKVAREARTYSLIEASKALNDKHDFRQLPSDQKNALVLYRFFEKLPFLFAYVSLPLGSLENAIYRQFAKEFQGVRHQLNERIAASLFMRDFEFIHDHSAREIFERVDRGKRGVVTLLSTTYLDMIPRLAEMAGATIPVTRKSWIVGALSLLRIPVLMRESSQKVHDALGMRDDDVGKWVNASTKISSLLYGAELVKTDDVEEAAKEFVASLDAHDALAYPAEQRKSKEEKKHIAYSRVFNLGVPAVGVGWRMLTDRLKKNKDQNRDAQIRQTSNRPRPDLKDFAFHGLGALGELVGTHRQQELLEQRVGEIVGIYEAHIKSALADIRQMEEFLGPYDALDTPDGPKEQARLPVSDLPNVSIHVENLHYKNILNGISLDIPQGSFTAITGPKGVGKTTLVRALMGLYAGESGTVQYGGTALVDIKKYGEQAFTTKIAYANQNPIYFENMTLRDNLLLWSHRKVPDEKISQILTELGMEKYADKLDGTFRHYSGGEMRMIGLARALMKDPQILFLDEPTSNLDPDSALQVTEVIGRMREKRAGMTVVAVTHDKHFADIADQKLDFRLLNNQPVNGNGKTNGGEGNQGVSDNTHENGELRDNQVYSAVARPDDMS